MLGKPLKNVTKLGAPHKYFMSEKLNGIRAAWDGRSSFWTRGKQKIAAPASFRRVLPRGVPLNGELYAGRGRFGTASSLWRSPSNAAWLGKLQYRVFDMPKEPGAFEAVQARLAGLLPVCEESGPPFAMPACSVPHERVASHANIQRRLETLLAADAEGVMLRRGNRPYRGGRSGNIYKLKKGGEREAVVVGYEEGRGALTGSVGSLVVSWPGSSKTWRVGSGLTMRERMNARRLFPVGARVTVRFMELNPSGVPRHPVLKGLRNNL